MKKWLALLLICVLLPAAALAEGNTMMVEGVAVITAQPDQAVVHIGYSEENEESKAAQQNAAKAIADIRSTVLALGIDEEWIKTASIQTYPYYSETDGIKSATYCVEYMLAITVNDLNQLGDVLDASFLAGANKLYEISYSASNEDELYQEALKQAVKKAMAKAEAIAQAAGLWLGQTLEINETSYFRPLSSRQAFNDSAKYMMEAASGFGGMAIPADMEITAIVNIMYSIR